MTWKLNYKDFKKFILAILAISRQRQPSLERNPLYEQCKAGYFNKYLDSLVKQYKQITEKFEKSEPLLGENKKVIDNDLEIIKTNIEKAVKEYQASAEREGSLTQVMDSLYQECINLNNLKVKMQSHQEVPPDSTSDRPIMGSQVLH